MSQPVSSSVPSRIPHQLVDNSTASQQASPGVSTQPSQPVEALDRVAAAVRSDALSAPADYLAVSRVPHGGE